jgi:hypothetical protein
LVFAVGNTFRQDRIQIFFYTSADGVGKTKIVIPCFDQRSKFADVLRPLWVFRLSRNTKVGKGLKKPKEGIVRVDANEVRRSLSKLDKVVLRSKDSRCSKYFVVSERCSRSSCRARALGRMVFQESSSCSALIIN